MMSVTAAPANPLQALMSADTAAPPEQPSANAAQFAALIAGLGIVPQPAEADASASTDEAGSKDQAGGDLPTGDGAGKQEADGETDPLAAALAMLPAAMQQAVVAQPAAAGDAATATQSMPRISSAALAATRQGKAGVPKADGPTADMLNVAETPKSADTPKPDNAADMAGAAVPVAVGRLVGQALVSSKLPGKGKDPAETAPASAVDPAGVVSATDPKLAATQGAAAQPLPQLASAAKPVGTAADAPPAPSRPAKDKAGKAAVTAIGATDGVSGPTGMPVPQPTTPSAHPSGSNAVATAQTPIAHALAQQHLKISSDGQWLDQLARDIATTADPNGKLSFHLNPEHLGSLTVEVTRGAEGASVRLTADTDAARTILIDAQPKLEAEARAQGVKIAETHVDLGGQNAQGQGTNGQGARQQQAQPEPMLRTFRAGDFAAGVTTNTSGSARGAAAELYA